MSCIHVMDTHVMDTHVMDKNTSILEKKYNNLFIYFILKVDI